MSTPEIHPALRDRAAELERLRPTQGRASISASEDESQIWSAICLEKGCTWRRDGLPGLDAATTAASSHSAVTKLKDKQAHRVRPIGRITVVGDIVRV